MKTSTATRWGVGAIILLSISLALYIGRAIFIPLVIALLLSAMLWPMANWMHRAGVPMFGLRRRPGFPGLRPYLGRARLPWPVACLTVVVGLVALVLVLTTAFGFGLSKMVIDLADEKKQNDVYKDLRGKLERVSPVKLDEYYFHPDPKDSKVLEAFRNFFNPNSQAFVNLSLRTLGTGMGLVWESILIMFILLFLLLEGRMLSRRVVEIFGTGAVIQGQVVEALKDMANQVRAYLVWRTIINFAMAAFLGVVYYLSDLKFPWTWALLTAILWYIPYIGPIVAGIPPVLDAFVSCESPWVAVFILGFYSCFVVVEGYVVVPVIMGRSMEMNATTVMLACLFWEQLWGSTGLFLAMPLMAAVKAVCTHVPGWKPWANLMSTEEEDEHPPGPPASPSQDGRASETIAAERV